MQINDKYMQHVLRTMTVQD